jgi:hypothetical protein
VIDETNLSTFHELSTINPGDDANLAAAIAKVIAAETATSQVCARESFINPFIIR